jgi:hypothetical protein
MDTNGSVKLRGDLIARKITPPGVGLDYKIRNLPHLVKGWLKKGLADQLGIATMYGVLEARLFKADGTIVDYGIISTRVVTTAWITAMATYMFDGSTAAPTAYDYHDCGTGVGAEAVGDTGLGTPYGGARTNGTPTNPSAGVYRSVGTVSFTSTLAITEHGLFSAAAAGTLLDRSVFSAINVVSGDAIQFTYSLTWTAGG